MIALLVAWASEPGTFVRSEPYPPTTARSDAHAAAAVDPPLPTLRRSLWTAFVEVRAGHAVVQRVPHRAPLQTSRGPNANVHAVTTAAFGVCGVVVTAEPLLLVTAGWTGPGEYVRPVFATEVPIGGGCHPLRETGVTDCPQQAGVVVNAGVRVGTRAARPVITGAIVQ